MSLVTAVIRSAADKHTASLFLQETKVIKALLKQYEARGYMLVDVLPGLPYERLFSLIKGNNRRKEVWIYHHLGPWDARAWEIIQAEMPALKLLYISGPISPEQLAEVFSAGVKVVLTTGSQAYSSTHLLFARKFYANLSAGAKLENAFEQARIFVEMEEQQPIQKPAPFLQWKTYQPTGQLTVPWTLFYAEEGLPLLSMSLPQKGEVHIVSKTEQRFWLTRQKFKDVFLKSWGQAPYQFHVLTIEDGPLGMSQLGQVIREEVCLPYQQAGVRVLKIDFSASLEEAQVKLLDQLREAMGISHKPHEKKGDSRLDGLVFLIKIFQSEWPHYGPKLLEWMVETAIPRLVSQNEHIDFIFMCALIEDKKGHVKKTHTPFSIKRIVDSCKVFAPSEWIDFRL